MSPLPCMRTDRPRPDPSPHRRELLDDLDELNGVIELGCKTWVASLASTAAAAHAGGIDKKRLEDILIEQVRDELHLLSEWLENRLEEVR